MDINVVFLSCLLLFWQVITSELFLPEIACHVGIVLRAHRLVMGLVFAECDEL